MKKVPIKGAAPIPEGACYYPSKGSLRVIACSAWSSSTVSEVVGAHGAYLLQPTSAWSLSWAIGGVLRLDSLRAVGWAPKASGAPKFLAALRSTLGELRSSSWPPRLRKPRMLWLLGHFRSPSGDLRGLARLRSSCQPQGPLLLSGTLGNLAERRPHVQGPKVEFTHGHLPGEDGSSKRYSLSKADPSIRSHSPVTFRILS